MQQEDLPMHRSRTATTAVTATLVMALASSACTNALEADDAGATVDAWPEVDAAGTATSPVAPGVELTAHEVMRSGDGLTTLLMDVDNQSNEDTTLGDLFDYTSVPHISLYDPDANVEYGPLQIDDDIESGSCLCSSASVPVPAGETVTMYATYLGVPTETDDVRLDLTGSRFTSVDDVPVVDVGPFAERAGLPSVVEHDPDLRVTVTGVAPVEDGTLVTLDYRNHGSSEPVELSEFPSPGDLSLVDADGSAVFYPRLSDLDAVATSLDDVDSLGEGESQTVEVLMAGLPDSTDAVMLRGPGLRRSFPVPVDDEAGAADLDVPDALDEEEILSLHSPTLRYDTPMVPTAGADLPDVDDIGPALPDIDVTGSLTSAAQPGWTVAVRGVVRGPGEMSTLLVDLTRNGSSELWPEGLGLDEYADDLGGLSVIDAAEGTRYGVFHSGTDASSAGGRDYPDDGETVRGYALLPALEGDPATVSVDVPTFGQVDDVPVVDGPRRPEPGDVDATLRVRANDRLRMDVLDIGRLPGGNGSLVRARLVNESDPSAVDTTFAREGTDNLCDIGLTDPATGTYYSALPPCSATTWSAPLGQGDELAYEVRFPELPDDLEQVVVTAGGYFPSAPVAVADDVEPWYLTLPDLAEEAEGTVYVASTGSADGLETTTRTGDTVEVILAADVLFEFDSATLTPAARTRLADLAGRIGESAAAGSLTITGYTDDVGDEAYNQTLSEQRAAAVQAALEPALDRTDLTLEVSGRGEADPVAPNTIGGNDNPDGRATNRRVTITYTAD
jgi:outer membrane protein OmpA-like peptidoglycan-associated protein